MASGVNFNARINMRTVGLASVGGLVSGVKKVGTAFGGLKKAAAEGSAGTYVLGGTLSALKKMSKNLTDALPALILAIGQKLVSAVKRAYQSFKNLVKEGMELAKVQYAVENKVSTVFGQENLDAIKAEASRVQGIGIIGDEKLMQAAVPMGAAGLSTQDTIRLLEGVADLAVAKAEDPYSISEGDLQTYGELLAKAVVTGNTKSIRTYLPDLNADAFKNAGTEERLDMIYDAMESSNIRGMNANMAETDQGKTLQVENKIGDVKEEIGKYGLRMERLFYEIIDPYLPTLQEIGETIMTAVTGIISTVAVWMDSHKERIKYYLLKIAVMIQDFFETFNVEEFTSKVLDLVDFVINKLPIILGIIIAANLAAAGINFASALSQGGAMAGSAMSAAATGGSMAAGRTVQQINQMGWVQRLGAANAFSRAGVTTGTAFFNGEALAVPTIATTVLSVLAYIGIPLLSILGIYKFATAGTDGSANQVLGGVDENGNKVAAGGANFSHYKLGERALGTPYSMPNTTTTINERGGEIMRLPSGTMIIPADKSAALLNGRGNIEVNVNVQGNVIGNRQFLDDVGTHVVRRLQTAMVSF